MSSPCESDASLNATRHGDPMYLACRVTANDDVLDDSSMEICRTHSKFPPEPHHSFDRVGLQLTQRRDTCAPFTLRDRKVTQSAS